MDITGERSEHPLRALVVVPTYNEAGTLPALLKELFGLPIEIDILIVDDASPDGTQDVVKGHPEFERHVFLLPRERKLGLANAYKAGFHWTLERAYDVCLEMDADFSHDPQDVPKLLEAIRRGDDIAIGSRYLGGIRVINWPRRRLILSLFAGIYTRRFTGLPLTDPTSGFKAIRRSVLESLHWDELRADGYAFQIELHYRASKAGFILHEIPIVFTERRSGSSKMSHRIAWEAAWRVMTIGVERIIQWAKNRASRTAGNSDRRCTR